ncbi:MAG: hypothetical protein MH321_15285 [Leptospiraceae bacterium]|nr:hypothetical protein [Leptospiraceae bacterium]
MNNLRFKIIPLFFLGYFALFQAIPCEESREKKQNLLRVLPAFRPEECDWAIRKFICLRCLKNGKQYAQNIIFDSEDRAMRIHGCFSERDGFIPIDEGRDHSTDFKE